MSIPFTWHLRPNGRRAEITIDRPEEIEQKARAVIAAGLHFEAEVLTTGTVSVTVADRKAEEDLCIELAQNGPAVVEAVDRLVTQAYDLIQQRAAAQADRLRVKYPHITVNLSESDGNAFAIVGRVAKAMRRGGCTVDQVKEFQKEAMAGDYDHLLQTCMRYVEVE